MPFTSHSQTESTDNLPIVAQVGDYDLVRINSKDVGKYMKITPDDQKVPDILRGLWWMDGNPAADEVFSLASFQCQTDSDGDFYDLPVYGEKIWTWHDNADGISLYKTVHNSGLVYRVRMSSDKKFEAVPIVHVFGFPIRAPRTILEFNAHIPEGNDANHWIRDSHSFGTNIHNYNLTRIVDKEGVQIEPNFKNYVKDSETPKTLLLPLKRRGE